jgi:hypothetical protein
MDVYRFASHIERDIGFSARSLSRHLENPGDIYVKLKGDDEYKILLLNVKIVRASNV